MPSFTIFVFVLWQVTYVLEGAIAHEDFCGHTGRLNPGDLQVQQKYLAMFDKEIISRRLNEYDKRGNIST